MLSTLRQKYHIDDLEYTEFPSGNKTPSCLIKVPEELQMAHLNNKVQSQSRRDKRIQLIFLDVIERPELEQILNICDKKEIRVWMDLLGKEELEGIERKLIPSAPVDGEMRILKDPTAVKPPTVEVVQNCTSPRQPATPITLNVKK